MELCGYRDRGEKRSGGVKSIVLIDAQSVVNIEYSSVSNSYVKIQLKNGVDPVEYQFKEQQALYTEQLKRTKNGVVVEHTLLFVLEPISVEASRAVEQMAEQSRKMVALVTTNNDVTLLVGYSERFEMERALEITKSYATTGVKHAETTGEKITLSSADAEKAKSFDGVIEQV